MDPIIATQNRLYTNAVKISHQFMTDYETFRKNHPDQIYSEERCWTENCSWCKYGKDRHHKFLDTDLENNKTIRCKYNIEKRMKFGDRLIETHLYGTSLTQIKEINKYVITKHGTYHPYKYIKIPWTEEKKYNPMFIRFNAPLKLAIRICQCIEKHYPDYSYSILDMGKRKVIGIKDKTLGKYTLGFKISVLERQDKRANWYDGFSELMKGDNILTEVVIEDTDWKKDDLYRNILGVLEKIAVDWTTRDTFKN
jgi:hypothetical protein